MFLFTFALISAFTLRAEDLPRQAAEILSANCLSCHGAAMQMSDLDLRSRQAMLKGGKRGPALVPGDGFNSLLLRLASHSEQPAMPPGKKLQDWQLAVLRQWVATGAPLEQPIGGLDEAKKALAAMENRPITEQERQFWAFQPVRSSQPPSTANRKWVRNPIDAFLLHAMEQRKLRPSPEAGKRTLVRRAYLDLWGLPPSLDQVQEFLNDTRPQAWERLIDKLLDSPHYGERWGRHWLDLVRYADSGGFEYDRDRSNSWRYRDWVVRALTNDMPYDEFVRLQIAGDEINPSSHDAIIATGFLRLGPEANIKTEMTRMDELDDILSTSASAFLGVTLGCARCHDHKFDPIPQKDYYRMQAVFFSTKPHEFPLADADRVDKHKQAVEEFEKRVAPLRKERESVEKIYRDKLAAASRAKLPDYVQEALRTPPEKRTEGQKLNVIQVEKTRDFDEKDVLNAMSAADRARHTAIEVRIEEMEKSRPRPLASAMAIAESGATPEPSHFLHRGSPDSKGSVMTPGVLSVIARAEPAFPPAPENGASSHRRKAFAQWLTSPENPLFSRVMVNRLWQHHFGEGLVRTPNNFGKTGEAPTHPLLLDWLGSEFVRQKWSMKAVHRLMMTSSAYRMASDDIVENRAIDAANHFLWKMPLRRLEGEIIRDSILASAGTLNRAVGGPGVYPYIDPSLWQGSSGRKWPGKSDDDPAAWRRSIYVFSKRSIPLPMLEVFDKPDSFGSCARRNRSTIAPQALILMNNSFVRGQAERLAGRIRAEAGEDAARQAELAFEIAFARPPSAAEKTAAVEFLSAQPEALLDFCQALFNSNEFVYMP